MAQQITGGLKSGVDPVVVPLTCLHARRLPAIRFNPQSTMQYKAQAVRYATPASWLTPAQAHSLCVSACRRPGRPRPLPQLAHVELAAGLQAEDEDEEDDQAEGRPGPATRRRDPGQRDAAAVREWVNSGLMTFVAIRSVLGAAGAPPAALRRPPADLIERELQVLCLLAAGYTNRQIAGELVISQSTVRTHTVQIYGKCGVSTRTGLTKFAI